jgi:hypothetical protein
LYDTVETGKPGPKTAKPNYGLQVALTHSSIGISGFNDILIACNIPPPGDTGMQKTANKICDQLIEVNKDDMSAQRQHLQEVNRLRGLGEDAGIRAEADGRYNNPLWSGGGRCPGQPATQATAIIVENVTPRKKIIAVHTANKLCAKCGNRPGIECPDCSANVPLDEPIGNEELWTQKAVESMMHDKNSATYISYLTTDRDSGAARGARRGQMRPLVMLADTQHLGKAVYASVKKANFSNIMLGHRPASKQAKLQIELAKDIKRRVEADYCSAFEKYNGELARIKAHLTHTMDAITECVQGNCDAKCKKYSACSGKPRGRFTWVHRSFAATKNQPLELTNEDKKLLQQCLSIRLGKNAIDMQRFKTSTQKSESTHRTFSKTNPRLLTCKRNFPARIHSGIHTRNHGVASSTLLKCHAVGASLTPGSLVSTKLRTLERRSEQRRLRCASKAFKRSRVRSRVALYAAYSRKAEKETYRKNMLDSAVKSIRYEHTYATRSRKTDHTYAKLT